MTRFEEYQQQQQTEAAQFLASDAVQGDAELKVWFEICQQFPTLKGTGTADNLAHAAQMAESLQFELMELDASNALHFGADLLAHIQLVNKTNIDNGHKPFDWPEETPTAAAIAGGEQLAEYEELAEAELEHITEQIGEYWERLEGWDADQDARHLDHETERQDAIDAPDFFSEYAEGHHHEGRELDQRKRSQDARSQLTELMKANPKKVAERLIALDTTPQAHISAPIVSEIARTQLEQYQARARKFLGIAEPQPKNLKARQDAATDDARAAVKTASPKLAAHWAKCLTWNNKAHQDRLATIYGAGNLTKMKQWAEKQKAAK